MEEVFLFLHFFSHYGIFKPVAFICSESIQTFVGQVYSSSATLLVET